VRRALLLVDHGSRRSEANAVLEELAVRVRARLPDRIVAFAHLDLAEPTVAQAIAACVAKGATEIVVHPYFLAPGNHSKDDIPRLAQAALADHPDVRLRITPALGMHDKLVEVVLERVLEAEAARPGCARKG
jgi:sirohydrochlorin ferrochelatase